MDSSSFKNILSRHIKTTIQKFARIDKGNFSFKKFARIDKGNFLKNLLGWLRTALFLKK